jgi:ribosomal protein L37AE/L43A
MTETMKALCPDCGPASGDVDELYGFWTCAHCAKSWLLSDVHDRE